MSEEYKGKGYRLAPILKSMNGGWGLSQALYFFQRAIPITMRRDIHGYYNDLDEIKEELPEIWNKTEVRLRRARDDKYAKLSYIIQSILVEEHELFWDDELPCVFSKTCRYVYAYPPKDFMFKRDEEESQPTGEGR